MPLLSLILPAYNEKDVVPAVHEHITAMGPVFARSTGCVSIPCEKDTECEDHGGACVNGVCQEGIGHCVEVVLIP